MTRRDVLDEELSAAAAAHRPDEEEANPQACPLVSSRQSSFANTLFDMSDSTN